MKTPGLFKLELRLCLASILVVFLVALWLRSYRSSDLLTFTRPRRLPDNSWQSRYYGLWTSAGQIVFFRRQFISFHAENITPHTSLALAHAPPYRFASIFT